MDGLCATPQAKERLARSGRWPPFMAGRRVAGLVRGSGAAGRLARPFLLWKRSRVDTVVRVPKGRGWRPRRRRKPARGKSERRPRASAGR